MASRLRVGIVAESTGERIALEALARAAGLADICACGAPSDDLRRLIPRDAVDVVLASGTPESIETIRAAAPERPIVALAGDDASTLALLGAGADEATQRDAKAIDAAVRRALVRTRAFERRLATRPSYRRHNVALAQVAQTVRAHVHESLEAKVRVLTELAAESLAVSRSGVWIYDDEHSMIRAFDVYDARTGAHVAGAELRRVDFPDYFAALGAERAFAANDARNDPATCAFTASYLEPNDIGALLDAPIWVGERVLGILCHEHVGGPRVWTNEDRSIAAGIADFVALGFETHERQRAEESLRVSQIALEQSRRIEAVGRLAGGIAHDFNNMLTVILSYSELLRRRLGEDHPFRPIVDEIARAGHHAAEMTRKLLSVSRRERPKPRVLDLAAVVRDMEPFLRQLIREDVVLELSLPRDPAWVCIDGGQLEQVLLNLAVNARDAMPTGGVLTIGADVTDDVVKLFVRDTGRGMEPEVRARIFEPFFTTKEPGKGTGLGLFTVLGIVRDAEGSIEVQTAPGAGTEIRVCLPLSPPEEAHRTPSPASTPKRPPSERAGGSAPTPSQETILLVEDEDAVREVVSQMLFDLGYDVLIARSGEEALRIARQHRGAIDLLLSDVVMPSLSGPALADRLLRFRPSTRVLFVSGYAEDALRLYGERIAGAPLLPKPFDRATLVAKIREVLGPTPRELRAPM